MDRAKYTNSAKMGDGNSNNGNVTDSFNNTYVNATDERRELMQWLSPLEPQTRHQGVRADRLDGVGNWLLETNEFREWRSGKGEAVLLCSGNPGVGKTHLKYAAVFAGRRENGHLAVAGVYCNFCEQQEQTTANIMGAILKQLVERDDETLETAREAFLKAKAKCGGRRLQLPDHIRMLGTTTASLPQVFICIDALDELTPNHLLELLVSLKEIIQGTSSVRVFLTARPHVEDQTLRWLAKAVTIPISPNPDDIQKYLQRKLEMDAEPYAMNPALRADILSTIRERVSETFLLVSLIIDAILGEVTIFDRRYKLNEMTKGNGLGDAYAKTLARMKAQAGSRPRLGLETLMWVSNSERPLQAAELCHALSVEIGSTDLDLERVPAIQTLLGCSLGLITFEKSSSTVQLVHFTLQEYLSGHPTLFQSPHSMIAEVCLTYLNFLCIRDLSPNLCSVPPTTPLVGYASCYWGSHARRGMMENVKSLGVRLLDGFDRHISSQLLLLHYNRGGRFWEPSFCRRNQKGFTGFHGAASLGIAEIVVALLEAREWDVNATDSMGNTGLTWAAIGGHEKIVKMLLGRDDVNPDTTDTEHGQTPLLWAAIRGHGKVVRMLLGREDVNPNTADARHARTPLLWAAIKGHEEVVRMLLEREDVNPDTADYGCGRTPLLCAAYERRTGVVHMLLKREDVNPNTKELDDGQTLLSWAAEIGYEDLARMLLERKDTIPDTVDIGYGQTPLVLAAMEGHTGVVQMLLEREDVDPNKVDAEFGQTPLLWAILEGHTGVAQVLLKRGDVNPNTADTESGQTPLTLAAMEGHARIVKMLLKREDINPNTPDTESGRTPLSWAAENGHGDVVRMLLEREDVDPNTPGTGCGRTPLSWAAENGHADVTRMVLARGDVNPDTVGQL